MASKDDKKALIRAAAENDLTSFISLVTRGKRVLGSVHEEVNRWWERPERKSHQLLLLPRDHQKSALIGFRTAQYVIKHPDCRILYISSTSNLATKQLGFIKKILASDVVRFYWPDLINVEEGKREKWTESEISVDHPLRKIEGVRDPTIYTAGLTTNIVGMHADITVLDDIVTNDTAYTEEGRSRVKTQYSFLASVGDAKSEQWVVGTRYHPKDLYNDFLNMNVEIYNDEGGLAEEYQLFEIFERQVEDRGDGTGQFLWPKQVRADGRTFGFDQRVLASKKAQYLDRMQFRAQYYNNPNDPDSEHIPRENFQYYDKQFLSRVEGRWFMKGRKLNVFASVDFAFSLAKKADSSAIVVVGVDSDRNYYVLDIDRFKADGSPSEYFRHILALHQKWDFRKLRAEVNVAQVSLVNALKQDYIRVHGLSLSIDEYRPTRAQGTKEERINTILQPKYDNKQIWHYQGGLCQSLEEELVLERPPHDDIKDALASCIDFCEAPAAGNRARAIQQGNVFHARFGGAI